MQSQVYPSVDILHCTEWIVSRRGRGVRQTAVICMAMCRKNVSTLDTKILANLSEFS